MELRRLFGDLLAQDPLPEEALTRLCLQLHFLVGQQASRDALIAAARASPPAVQAALELWFLNHWNQLPPPTLGQATARTMQVWATQLREGTLEIVGFDPERGLHFQPLTEGHEDR